MYAFLGLAWVSELTTVGMVVYMRDYRDCSRITYHRVRSSYLSAQKIQVKSPEIGTIFDFRTDES